MAMTLDQLVAEAAQLPEEAAAELVERILVQRHGGIEPSIESAWKSEIANRVREVAEGRVEGIPAEEALARAARALRK
jgi:hypothetical protein